MLSKNRGKKRRSRTLFKNTLLHSHPASCQRTVIHPNDPIACQCTLCQIVVVIVVWNPTALSLAIGVIFYISAVNDEVSHRKKPGTSDESFQYNYGWAFFFAGSSFLSSMMAAVTNVSLYLRRYPNLEDMVLIIPGLDKHSRLDAKSGEDVDYCEPHPGSQNPTIILWPAAHDVRGAHRVGLSTFNGLYDVECWNGSSLELKLLSTEALYWYEHNKWHVYCSNGLP